MSKTLWISWTRARRSRDLAPEFGARFYEFSWHRVPPLRYAVALAATLAVLAWHRPRLVFVQNPSIFCAALLTLLRKVFRFRLVVDTHTVVIPIRGWKGGVFSALTRLVERNADLCIVTNQALAEEIEARGGRAAVLPDKIPELPVAGSAKLPGRWNIVYICSFAHDEPYHEVIRAAAELGPDVHVTITGDYRRVRDARPSSLPPNAHLTGYVGWQDYVNLLHAADAIVVLTRVPQCMLRGAYEALAAEKPLVLSDQVVLREYFNSGVIHVDNSAGPIQQAVRNALADAPRLRVGIAELRRRRAREWPRMRDAVRRAIPERS